MRRSEDCHVCILDIGLFVSSGVKIQNFHAILMEDWDQLEQRDIDANDYKMDTTTRRTNVGLISPK